MLGVGDRLCRMTAPNRETRRVEDLLRGLPRAEPGSGIAVRVNGGEVVPQASGVSLHVIMKTGLREVAGQVGRVCAVDEGDGAPDGVEPAGSGGHRVLLSFSQLR